MLPNSTFKRGYVENEMINDKGYIYIVKGFKGWRKVGVTNNIKRRMMQLQTASPTKLMLEAAIQCSTRVSADEAEREIHKLLRGALTKTGGAEWYNVGPHTLRNFVMKIAKNYDGESRLSFFNPKFTMTKKQKLDWTRKEDKKYAFNRRKARRAKRVSELLAASA